MKNTSENPELLAPGEVAAAAWIETYLTNATTRFQNLITGYNWTVAATYSAQTLCPYETVAFGYSPFCGLFTAEEWQGFEYSIDMEFQAENGIYVYEMYLMEQVSHHRMAELLASVGSTN